MTKETGRSLNWLNLSLPLLISAVALLLLVALVAGRGVQAGPTFTINSPDDAADVVPGDGVCETAAGNNVCTLRAAVQEANALPGMDSVLLPAGSYTLTIAGTGEDAAATGDLDITDSLVLDGAGRDSTTISGGGIDRVLHVLLPAGETVQVSGVTLRDGNGGSGDGGGIYVNNGRLLLAESRVAANTAGNGGGIYNAGTLTATNTLISDNSAAEDGAGVYVAASGVLAVQGSVLSNNHGDQGGGLYLDGDFDSRPVAIVAQTAISGNTATRGAGIFASVYRLRLSESLLAGNVATTDGGGVRVSSAFITITETTIRDNVVNGSGGAGGGILVMGGIVHLENSVLHGNKVVLSDSDGGGLSIFGWSTILNSTFSGNEAVRGGGMSFGIGTHVLSNTTFYSNTATLGNALFDDPIYGAVTTLHNTIVAGNAAATCVNNGDIQSAGYNIDNGSSCGLAASGDQSNTNPLLGPLQDNGGATWTHALLPESPAVDAGDPAGCPETDQRAAPRPVDGDGDGDAVCDVGAYEFGSAVPTPTPSPTPPATATSTPGVTPTPTVSPLTREHYLPAIRRAESQETH